MDGWYVVENRGSSGRRLAGPFDDPSADEVSEAVRRLYAELGAGCCDLAVEYREDED
jgi:hypothetical protein